MTVEVEFGEPRAPKTRFTDERAQALRDSRIPLLCGLTQVAGQLVGEVFNMARHPLVSVPRNTKAVGHALTTFADGIDAVSLEYAELIHDRKLRAEHLRQKRAAEEMDEEEEWDSAFATS